VTAPEVGFESHDAGVRIAWAYILSPTTNISASAGITRTNIASEEVSGSTWTLKSTHNSELSQWSFSLTRDIVPSGFGLLIRRDELDLSVIRSVAPRLDATLSAQAAHNSDLVASFTGDNRRYVTGAAGFNWHAAPQWVWSFTVRASAARIPTDVADLQSASGWQTVLTILWTPLPWTKSRWQAPRAKREDAASSFFLRLFLRTLPAWDRHLTGASERELFRGRILGNRRSRTDSRPRADAHRRNQHAAGANEHAILDVRL
jgi:hypothetical protein